MKEITVYIATIFMEFSNQETCNAFYKHYYPIQHIAECAAIIKYVDFDETLPEFYPLARPADLFQ